MRPKALAPFGFRHYAEREILVMGKLDGKVAAITGGGRGIGRGIARAFAAQGCAVVINDLAIPRPIPRPPPVIAATLPSSLPIAKSPFADSAGIQTAPVLCFAPA